MAIVFLQYSYVCTNAPISFCIPEEIPSRIFILKFNFFGFWAKDATLCSAVFSHFGKHVHHVHDLINEHLRQSLLYSVMVNSPTLTVSQQAS